MFRSVSLEKILDDTALNHRICCLAVITSNDAAILPCELLGITVAVLCMPKVSDSFMGGQKDNAPISMDLSFTGNLSLAREFHLRFWAWSSE